MSQALASGRDLIARTARLPGVSALDGAGVAGGAAALVGGVAAAGGGYFPTSWGWTALVLFWVVAIALLLRTAIAIPALELAFVGVLMLLGGWIWLSTTWSESAPRSFLDGQRVLVYIGAAAAAVLVMRRRFVPQLLGGVLVGITVISAYGLATRLFPNRLGTFDPIAAYRLQAPLGYWNALGIFAAIGIVLALGQAARARSAIARAVAAAALAVLLPTLYFTYSRGAWVALGVAILVVIVYEHSRLQLITSFVVAALAPAVAVAVAASRFEALTHTDASVAAATHDGERFAPVVLAAALVSAGLVVALAAAERRARVPPALRLAYAAVLLAAVVGTVGVAIAHYGSPATIVRDGYHRFTAKPTNESANLNERLFSVSGNGRAQLWKAAWQDYRDHAWLGSGAGTYEDEWYRRRAIDLDVRDAHNLYVEQLAELGPVGLGLLAFALLLPLAAAVRARGRRLSGAALGAYVAFLLHAAVDWDWEMTAVTLAGVLCGIALLVAARDEAEPRQVPFAGRFGGAGAAVALAALAFVGLVGNLAIAASGHAARRGDWDKAVAQARRATDWAPWSSTALQRLGEAELRRGNDAAAVAAFREAVAKDPNDWLLQAALAGASQGAESRAALRRAAELNPRGVAG